MEIGEIYWMRDGRLILLTDIALNPETIVVGRNLVTEKTIVTDASELTSKLTSAMLQ